ncbi:hypothetical protein MED121_15614 [Marinomonas sp. MED121]|uniref:hypothetical protein n=1 Tax=Marinomonas sp. MED121 TaxID=314277 RepID=UPI00006910AA|nr:hypothetical protein [Marinomonas sp. MED121]EAQ67368.1 hypothetical protein MED121_15614 [Marinomonas sp. MED121]
MKKIIYPALALLTFGLATNNVLASDYADEVRDAERSVTAIEKHLDSLNIQYNSIEIESGLNRSQEVRALEAKYDYLQNQI